MSARIKHYQDLLRIADNYRRGLLTEEEYCEQTIAKVLVADFLGRR